MSADLLSRRLGQVGMTDRVFMTAESARDAIEEFQCGFAVCCRDEHGKPLTFDQVCERVWGGK